MVRGIRRVFTRVDLHEAYQRTFNSPHGQIVLQHLMKVGCVTKPVAHGDTNQQARNAGAQHIVLSILRFLHKTPEQVSQQVNETIQDEHIQ